MIIHLKMTDDEYSYILTLLKNAIYGKAIYEVDHDEEVLKSNLIYISNALKNARKNGEIYRKKGGRKNANDQ